MMLEYVDVYNQPILHLSQCSKKIEICFIQHLPCIFQTEEDPMWRVKVKEESHIHTFLKG